MRLALALLAVTCSGATYYVSSAGNDANPGSIGSPWLTLNKAMNTIVCGDTVNIVANGSYVNGDGTIPAFSGCSSTTTIQSTALGSFRAIGYRARPVTDAANFGKLTLSNGLLSGPERHGAYFGCQIASIVGATFTMGFCNGISALTNGYQVFFQINNAGNGTASSLPSPLTVLTKYYVINCSAGCGTAGSTLQVSATSGGSAITPGTCTGTCILGALQLSTTIQVTAGSGTMTSPDAFVSWANGTQVAVSAVNLQLFGALPTGFALNTVYYVVNLSGTNFGLSATMGGAAIAPSDIGTGSFNVAAIAAANHFAFRGLEFYAPANPTALLWLGSGNETSTIGMVNNMEVDRSWFHGDYSACPSSGPTRGVFENGISNSIHDSYFQNFCTGEGQAILSCGSPGPTTITNNFLEASAEVTLSGGCGNSSGVANAQRTFTGNFYYKPPAWKTASSTGAASGPCWYDTTDPLNSGGEWYRDTAGSQTYRCNSGGMWATTGSTFPATFTVKNMAEHKNGKNFTYSGNVFLYSWVSAQTGQAMAFHQSEDSGPGAANDHITATNNKATNIFQPFTLSSFCNGGSFPCTGNLPGNHTITNNLFVVSANACGVTFTTGSNTCGAHMTNSTWGGYPSNAALLSKNTTVNPDGADAAGPTPGGTGYGASAFLASIVTSGCTPGLGLLTNWTFQNSLMPYDFQGDCTNGSGVFSSYFANSGGNNLALVGSNPAIGYASPGAGNFFTPFSRATNVAAVGYANVSTGDYHLSASSPYSAQNGSATLLSTDGTDLGADIDAINAATSGAVAGTPTWAVQENFTLTPSNVSAVLAYTRPGTTACSLTVYNAPARITANQNADTNTPGNKLDTRAGNTVVGENVTFNIGFVSPLTPSTTYYYSQSCVAADTSVWTIVGSFTTTVGPPTTSTRLTGNATISGNSTLQ